MTDTSIPIALVGIGKIARDQHIPAIAGHPQFTLAATVSSSGGVDGVENHATIHDLLAARPDITVVSLCMPPVPRFAAASAAIAAGRHVMLEKPPGASVAEVLTLEKLARDAGVTLFATWHSRHALGAAPAREWLADKHVTRIRVDWKEDVRKWHPGQDWIWEPGGMGVFDPGINALSLLTAISPVRLHLTEAELSFPENRATPIAAELLFSNGTDLNATAGFDWRQQGDDIWQIEIDTDQGQLRLTEGGARLFIDDVERELDGLGEYPDIYRHMGDLLQNNASDVDVTPLVHVSDAYMLGRHLTVEPFHD
ncbi:L-arabinose 1-dehydrogenase [Rhodobacteraceae bacterium THAF1]|uniref:Gfo/Idh/MocA family protein n=1 Tax=Palleronia sp. THAF1 TaxID=2587842 RepID=UPI000F4171DD|nr:Gfo/Idh/MocA family oxidoreductase [Palleronia sp. THAF1]QFU08101.1 L-arabinose 1-dehydrogenase [Palleronia sp. THAF1]VDC27964.1 L-arabinose 1-dehydrogenase [Rhodobacteraceae bacterium THAF1]